MSSEANPKGPWNDWYHCMGHTYGAWLHGDPRSFRTRHHREHIEGDYKHRPPQGKYDALLVRSKTLMKRDPVFLTMNQRIIIVQALVESLLRRNIDVAIASMTNVHFDLLARIRDHNPRHWIGIAKKESAFVARREGFAPEGGLWAIRSKALPIGSRDHQLRTAKYIHRHLAEGGAVWLKGKVLFSSTRLHRASALT